MVQTPHLLRFTCHTVLTPDIHSVHISTPASRVTHQHHPGSHVQHSTTCKARSPAQLMPRTSTTLWQACTVHHKEEFTSPAPTMGGDSHLQPASPLAPLTSCLTSCPLPAPLHTPAACCYSPGWLQRIRLPAHLPGPC